MLPLLALFVMMTACLTSIVDELARIHRTPTAR